MLIRYSKIINSPIYEVRTNTFLGSVSEIIFDFDNLKIIGLIVKGNEYFFKKGAGISATNIIELSAENAVYVDNEHALTPLEELIRIKKKYDDKNCGVGQRVETKSGKKIGKVYEILFENKSLNLKKFYVKNVFSERIITDSSIISIDNKKITIKDDYEAVRIGATVPSVI